jgi:hypothetical protein
VRVEAFGVRRGRLCGDVLGILEGSRPRQLTVEIAPSFGFGACDCRVRACIRFSRRHRLDDTEGWRRYATLPWEVGPVGFIKLTRSTTSLVAKRKNKIAAVQTSRKPHWSSSSGDSWVHQSPVTVLPIPHAAFDAFTVRLPSGSQS